MTRPRKIEIPEGFECNECGSTDLVGAGTQFKKNPEWNNNSSGIVPKRIKVQKIACKNCGKIMVNGRVKEV